MMIDTMLAALILHPKTHSVDIYKRLYQDADFSVSVRVKVAERRYPEFNEKNDYLDLALLRVMSRIDEELRVTPLTTDRPIDTVDFGVMNDLRMLMLRPSLDSVSIYGEAADTLRHVVVIRLRGRMEIKRDLKRGIIENLKSALAEAEALSTS